MRRSSLAGADVAWRAFHPRMPIGPGLIEGRRNRYEIDPSVPLRHQVEAAQTVGGLLALFLEPVEWQRLGLTGGSVPP